MGNRLVLTVICVFSVPLAAAADDYKRKDYLESYERSYERNGVASAPIHTKAPQAPVGQQQASHSSYDEYSLYEWSKNNAPREASPVRQTGSDVTTPRRYQGPFGWYHKWNDDTLTKTETLLYGHPLTPDERQIKKLEEIRDSIDMNTNAVSDAAFYERFD